MAVTKEWIAEQRKGIDAQRLQLLAQANACEGALQMLNGLEAELKISLKRPPINQHPRRSNDPRPRD